MRPRVGLVMGDPAGIGPELGAKLLAMPEVTERADVLIISDQQVLGRGAAQAGIELNPTRVADSQQPDFKLANPLLLEVPVAGASELPLAQVSQACGESALNNYKTGLKLASERLIGGFCFTPFNKGSLKLAGNPCEDELQFAAQELGWQRPVSEFNVLEKMWNARVTSHVPLKDVAGKLSIEGIVEAIHLANESLLDAGYQRPRIAVAALNPHAGDNGNIGREEIDIIEPAVRQAQALQIHADGPFPGDTLYLKIRDGLYDCAVTMYHDQGQTALKLLGFEKGVTMLGGLPFPVTTAAHGTAFDIAGRGVANPEAMRQAFHMVCDMVENRAA